MVLLLLLGLWLVLQPALKRDRYDYAVRVGSIELLVESRAGDGVAGDSYRFASPRPLSELGWMDAAEVTHVIGEQRGEWMARPGFERALLGFFNISSWLNFSWVAVGLLGQTAFFGRMMVQWVVSEKAGRSQVPELFWWLSLFGGMALFTYFVWRVDVVGVLGQSTGIVIYARNLRLIHKERKRGGEGIRD